MFWNNTKFSWSRTCQAPLRVKGQGSGVRETVLLSPFKCFGTQSICKVCVVYLRFTWKCNAATLKFYSSAPLKVGTRESMLIWEYERFAKLFVGTAAFQNVQTIEQLSALIKNQWRKRSDNLPQGNVL